MKTFKVWNMTTGEEYEAKITGIEELIGENPYRIFEEIKSHYNRILEKWFFYIRVRDKEMKVYETQILQISLKE